MDNRFIPYVGAEKYVFLSYSRGDTEHMLSVAHRLYEKKYRLWYDEGIPPGDDWAATIGEQMKTCGAVIFFLSAKALVSPNCFSEIKTAVETGKPLICVLCDECAEYYRSALRDGKELDSIGIESIRELCTPYFERRKDKSKIPTPGSWLSVLSTSVFVEGFDSDYARQEEDILATGVIDKSFIGPYDGGGGGRAGKNKWLAAIIISLAFFAAALYGVWGIQTGRVVLSREDSGEGGNVESAAATPAPTLNPELFKGFYGMVDFPDDVQGAAVELETGLSADDFMKENLKLIKSLHICGTMPTKDPELIRFMDGKWYVDTAPAVQGPVDDLSIIGGMYYLESLSLVYQSITDFSELSELPLLKTLNLAGNPITEIKELTGFPSLEELDLSHTGVTDLSGLDGLEELKRVFVSADMLPLDRDRAAEYEIVLVY